MTHAIALSEDQRDALQELMNISMGQAANSLAHLIETKIGIVSLWISIRRFSTNPILEF